MSETTNPAELYKYGIQHLNKARSLEQNPNMSKKVVEFYKMAIAIFRNLPKNDNKYTEAYFTALKGLFMFYLENDENSQIDLLLKSLDENTRNRLIHEVLEM